MFENKRQPIYRHQFLKREEIDRVKPLMESAFAAELARYNDGNPNRAAIGAERLEFAAAQNANRRRIAGISGISPLNEDAKIFGQIGDGQYKALFESYSSPGNIIGVGEVRNADAGNMHQGGYWNSAYKSGSGDIPSYIFGLQSQLALHCIGFDLMPVLAVDTPKVMTNYVDTVYGGGTFDNEEVKPSYIEITAKMLTHAYIHENELKRGETKLYFVAADETALEVRFIVGSSIKAGLTAEVLSTGKFSAGAYTEDTTYAVTLKAVVDKINEDFANAKVYQSNDLTKALDVTSPLSLNYPSATRTTIDEASSNDNSLDGMSRGQHEKGPKHKLNIISMDKQLEMVGLEIEADTNNIQIKDFAAMGVNVISMLYSGTQGQITQSLDNLILRHLYKMGVTHAVGVVESQGINHSLYIGAPATPSIKFSDLKTVVFNDMLGKDRKEDMGEIKNSLVSAGAENMMTHHDRMYARMLLIVEFGAYQTRIAPYDFIVASGTTCAALKKHSSFAICPVATTLKAQPELAYTGTIFENVSLYNNPKVGFDDIRVLFGRRGNDTDPGSKFLAYDLAASRQTIAEDTMAEKIRVWSRFAIADVGFYPELNYYVSVFKNDYGWA